MLLFSQYSETTKKKNKNFCPRNWVHQNLEGLAADMAATDSGCWLAIKSATVQGWKQKEVPRESLEVIELLLK